MTAEPASIDPTDIAAQVARAAVCFREAFGQEPTHAAVAPGRVNLIGEHTDYNGGFVCPLAIERQTVAVGRPIDEPVIEAVTTAFAGTARVKLGEAMTPGKDGWANYLRGVAAGVVPLGLLGPGAKVKGFRAAFDSTVPRGGGLSSSAALEVATATLVEALSGESIDPVQKALLCQKAEQDFAGVPCGIMDQYISAMGKAGHALLIDCKTNEPTAVPLDDPAIAVLVIDSADPHELSDGEFGKRRSQCETAAKVMGVELLRDADMAMLDGVKGAVDEVVYRRARHAIGEDDRTLAAVEAMRAGDWATVGLRMNESHDSLRDDYEVTTEGLDTLVELARQQPGVFGSRMTGGGFGGCTVTLVEADKAAAAAEAIVAGYKAKKGVDAPWFVTKPAAGARVVSVG
ncbi:MAG: galactokinase [Planctomycetota bacterium]